MATTSTPTVACGIVLQVGSKKIALRPRDIEAAVDSPDIDVELPPGLKVDLGTVGDDLSKVLNSIGTLTGITIAVPAWTSTLPDAFKTVATDIKAATFSIEQLHLKIVTTPGTTSGTPPKKTHKLSFQIGMSLDFPSSTQLKFAGVSLTSIWLELSHGDM